MQFPDSWFEDEVRDGFYVPALMKRAWAAQMETLEEIAKVCKKYHIRWFAMWGTLLGAVRHKGYIPWDDDLDICMLRDDYIRFNAVAKKELPEGFKIPPNSDKSDGRLHTTIWNSIGVSMEKEHLDKYHGFPYAAGIDIFAIDYAAPDPEDEELRKSLTYLTCEAALSVGDEEQDTAEIEAKIARVEEMLNVRIDRHASIKEQLFTLVENLSSMYTAEEANEVLFMPQWFFNRPYKWPLESFTNPVLLPFERMEIPAPSGYDAILTVRYGNYMEPCYEGAAHDYPYFGVQREKLAEILLRLTGTDKSPYKYCFSMEDLKKTKSMGRRSAQKALEDFLQLAGKIHREIFTAIETDSSDKAQKLLELCQNSAIRIGTMLEQMRGEKLTTVHILEEYCELTYQIHEGLNASLILNAGEAYKLLEESLIRIRDCANHEIKGRREVVFLPYKAALWESLEPVWKQAAADPNCDVYVIPIPYYYRNFDGSFKEMHYEGDQFPDYVPITDYNSYQLKKRQPDVIFIHNPYDEYNLTISVHPYFYSKELILYTDMLIYTPYFTLNAVDPEDEKSIQNMEYYVTMPGVVHADKVLLHSEQMRQSYIDFLTKTAGENTRNIWEEKISVF